MSATPRIPEAGRRLTVIPALRARAGSDGTIVLTRKFVDGLLAYAGQWPGPVRVLMQACGGADDNLDHVAVDARALPFELRVAERPSAAWAGALCDSDVALVSLVDRNLGVAEVAGALGVPLVYMSELSRETRRQIARSTCRNPLRRWRRAVYTERLERRYRQAVAQAAGLQCNGTPTYEAYRSLNDRALLYFDTRVRDGEVAGDAVLDARTARLRAGAPLTLVFSGRLIDIKGADHLPLVAAELAGLGVPFEMHVCGGGSLEPALRQAIARLGLGARMHLRGVLDFCSQLLPFVRGAADLFVCCHLQGDPSCTYLETFACGTPIAGYDNAAFAGLVRTSGVGWLSPLGEAKALAWQIARLHQNRAELVRAAYAARDFAALHTFERTVRARIEHLLAAAARRREAA